MVIHFLSEILIFITRYGEERVRSSENVKNAGPEKESTAPAPCQEPSLDYAKAVRGAVFSQSVTGTYQPRPDQRSPTYNRKGGRYGTGPGTRNMHPGTGDQVDRCFLSQKEPEEPARKCHGEVAERCEAAGNLLLVPELRDLPRYPCAEILGHL